MLGGMVEDDGAVLRPHVRSLAVQLRRIVVLLEHLEKLLVSDPERVVLDLYHFGMPRHPRANGSVGRVLGSTSRVPDGGVDDTLHFAKRRLYPQKQPAPRVAFSVDLQSAPSRDDRVSDIRVSSPSEALVYQCRLLKPSRSPFASQVGSPREPDWIALRVVLYGQAVRVADSTLVPEPAVIHANVVTHNRQLVAN